MSPSSHIPIPQYATTRIFEYSNILILCYSFVVHKLFRLASAVLLLTALTGCAPRPQSSTDRTADFLALLNPNELTPVSSASSRSIATSRTPPVPATVQVSSSTNPPAQSQDIESTLNEGSKDAPLELLVFTNHSCAYCRQFEDEIMPKLREAFVTKGNVMIRTAILPIRKYPMSTTETLSLFCAREQGKGAELHRALFTLPQHNLASIMEAAAQWKMDTQKFAMCLSSQPALTFANAQKDLAESMQVTLVPTLVLNGEKQPGLQRYADLRGWIESKMK